MQDRKQKVTKMKMVLTSCIVVVILLLAAASQAAESDFRCGNEIISVGDRKFDVLRKCGEPVQRGRAAGNPHEKFRVCGIRTRQKNTNLSCTVPCRRTRDD